MSSETGQIIDHETIRAIGDTMAQNIGALAAQTADREATITFLNTCAEDVPYAAMFEEDDRLASSIGEFDNGLQSMDEVLEAELARLDGLASTFATRMPDQLEAAKALVEQKKQAALSQASTQKTEINEPRAKLAEEREQLGVTLDSVLAPWPTLPYSEEVLEAAAQRRALLEKEALAKPRLILGMIPRSREQPRQIEKKTLGPHADLAESIPSLSERLLRPVSEHAHVYEGVETAAAVLDEAMAKPQAERTEKEDFLAKAVYVLRRRFLADPEDLSFLNVYEADDVIELAQRLRKFSRKNRPDFNDLEGQMLDKAAAVVPHREKAVP